MLEIQLDCVSTQDIQNGIPFLHNLSALEVGGKCSRGHSVSLCTQLPWPGQRSPAAGLIQDFPAPAPQGFAARIVLCWGCFVSLWPPSTTCQGHPSPKLCRVALGRVGGKLIPIKWPCLRGALTGLTSLQKEAVEPPQQLLLVCNFIFTLW